MVIVSGDSTMIIDGKVEVRHSEKHVVVILLDALLWLRLIQERRTSLATIVCRRSLFLPVDA